MNVKELKVKADKISRRKVELEKNLTKTDPLLIQPVGNLFSYLTELTDLVFDLIKLIEKRRL